MLQSHKADMTIATFTPNLERLKTVAFTDPYTTDVLTLMTRADRKDLATLEDFDRPEIKIAISPRLDRGEGIGEIRAEGDRRRVFGLRRHCQRDRRRPSRTRPAAVTGS